MLLQLLCHVLPLHFKHYRTLSDSRITHFQPSRTVLLRDLAAIATLLPHRSIVCVVMMVSWSRHKLLYSLTNKHGVVLPTEGHDL